jgi:ABC-type Fe3+ transport system permease subunit
MTTITTILLAVFGALLVAAYALWDLGADRLLASFGRFVVRAITFGRIRLESDTDYPAAMAMSAATLLVIFISFLIIASRVH